MAAQTPRPASCSWAKCHSARSMGPLTTRASVPRSPCSCPGNPSRNSRTPDEIQVNHKPFPMKRFNVMTRRSFLNRNLPIGAGVALSTLVDIPLVMKRALAESSLIGSNGKKLLFIFLRGANDGLNSVIPILDPAYAPSRPLINIPADPSVRYDATGSCLQVVNDHATDPTYQFASAIPLGNGFAALHPSLRFLANVYNAGDLALVHRVGYPGQNRSHFESQANWESGAPNRNRSDGLFYRALNEAGLVQARPLSGVSIQS